MKAVGGGNESGPAQGMFTAAFMAHQGLELDLRHFGANAGKKSVEIKTFDIRSA